MTKVYKIELIVIDHDKVGIDGVCSVIENARYPNRCISPQVINTETREVEWSDDHPLNMKSTFADTVNELFIRRLP